MKSEKDYEVFKGKIDTFVEYINEHVKCDVSEHDEEYEQNLKCMLNMYGDKFWDDVIVTTGLDGFIDIFLDVCENTCVFICSQYIFPYGKFAGKCVSKKDCSLFVSEICVNDYVWNPEYGNDEYAFAPI